MHNFYTSSLASIATVTLLAGCTANGGYNNYGLAGAQPAANLYGAMGNPANALESALLNTVIQNMAGSVANGQIGSQIPPADQNFRLQQLGGLVQSGAINQPQQWVNPQTGSAVAVKPLGQAAINQQTQQQCQNLQEAVTLPNGQSITENRVACLDPQSGKWTLVQ